jgi:hypothetical protein
MVTRQKPPGRRSPDSLYVKLGSWFEAHATGLGVIAIPFIAIIVALAAAFKFALG